ncbi:MAG: hypothetical protein M1308_16180 [Actinobacteria bacterium]|nr:hypothetical protein [Actinomycetota bacterium]
MKKYLLLLLIVFLTIDSNSDEVLLKSGGRVKGIISEENDENIVVKLKSGKVTLNRSDILSIEKDPHGNTELEKEWEAYREKEITNAKSVKSKSPSLNTSVSKTSSPKVASNIPSNKEPAVKTAPKYKQGEIFSVTCSDKKHTYSVCMPSNYDGSKRHPVLFCFDPGGNGRNAVDQFSFAAEKYGWIVIGSNDAKNGPWEPILDAQKAMLKDIKTRYNVDNNRFYAGGFSGGARMSYTIAYKNPMSFCGVIACGAGFGEGSISSRVAVFHCVGKNDTNAVKEMNEVYNQLKRRGIATQLKQFDGGHGWPPKSLLEEAVSWIAKQ